MRLTLLWILTFSFCVLPLAKAQSASDGGDYFVEAYRLATEGEKAEAAGNLKLAVSKLRDAAKQLDLVVTKFPTWSPQIVEYRKKRTAEAIVRVQEKMGHSGSSPGPVEPELPGDRPLTFVDPQGGVPPIADATQEPVLSEPAPRKRGGRTKPDDTDVSPQIGQIADRIKKLETELQTARGEVDKLQRQNADTAQKLEQAAKDKFMAEKRMEVLQKRSDNAESDLIRETNLGRASAEKIVLLSKEVAESRKLLNNAKIEAEADKEYRKQLNERYDAQLKKISALTIERDQAKSLSSSAPGKIAEIQKQLDATKKEKQELAVKLQSTETQLHDVITQRDDALAQVAKLKEAQKQVDKLVSDNASLMAKLSDAQKSVAQFKAEGAEKDKQIDILKKEVGSVREQLDHAKKESADYQQKMGDLQAKLEDSAKQLAVAKSENAESAVEKKKMQDENQILRGIVLRQQKKEAERTAMKKVVLGELSKLEINSKTLLKQIDFLSEPVVKLSQKERALFKKPELQVSDTEISILLPGAEEPAPNVAAATVAPANPEISVPDPKPTAPRAPETPAPQPKQAAPSTPQPALNPPKSEQPKVAKNDQPAKPSISLNQPSTPPPLEMASNAHNPTSLFDTKPTEKAADLATPAPTVPSKALDDSSAPLITNDSSQGAGNLPNVPAELIPLAKAGKEQFDRGNYLEAEKIYRKILAKAPRNLYTLSNLGVVLFRSGKLKLAEEQFNKAIAVAPEDGFSHCTIGIVYYSETKLDEAVNELTKALAINPKNATAHNYLGITASQKGWPEAAQKELETAVSLDPSYADAFFNLSVVFATQTPPNKELARKNYSRAIELGAEKDAALEQLIK